MWIALNEIGTLKVVQTALLLRKLRDVWSLC